MPLVSDVAAVIIKLGDVVKSTRDIIEAVNDGKTFLRRNYPEADKELSSLLHQMQRAIEGLARVTRVISGFRFAMRGRTVDLDAANRDLSRFNDYVIRQEEDVVVLRGKVRKLKADCDRVRVLRDKLEARAQSSSLLSMFDLLGPKKRQRAAELQGSLSNFYADDQCMIELLEETLAIAEQALEEVCKTLGPAGMASPYCVPSAAAVLASYATLFEGPQRELDRLADELSMARSSLVGA